MEEAIQQQRADRLTIQTEHDLAETIKALQAQLVELIGLLDALPILELILSGTTSDFWDTAGNIIAAMARMQMIQRHLYPGQTDDMQSMRT